MPATSFAWYFKLFFHDILFFFFNKSSLSTTKAGIKLGVWWPNTIKGVRVFTGSDADFAHRQTGLGRSRRQQPDHDQHDSRIEVNIFFFITLFRKSNLPLSLPVFENNYIC